jgi:hypothetical protein
MNATTPTLWAFLLAMSVGWSARPRPPIRRPEPTPHETRSPAGAGTQRSTSSDATNGRGLGLGVGVRRNARPVRRTRRSDGAVELARWCETLARAVRGGDTLRTALVQVEPPTSHADALVGLTRPGSAPHRSPVGDPDLAIVLAVVTACLEHGGPAAEPLDRAAGVLRGRAAERAERRVQSAQARLSATVLTWLPIAVLAVMVTTSPAVRRVVVSPIGTAVVTIGAIVNLVGWWWMRRIVERAAR